MNFFSKKAFARNQKADGTTDWNRLWGAYEKHLASVRPFLSPAWQELAVADFHDERILAVSQPSTREFIMDLQEARLKFTGVKFSWVPKTAVGDRWVYW